MRNAKLCISVIVIILSLLCFVRKTLAEPYVGGYLGLASAADSDFKNADLIFLSDNAATFDDDFSTNIDSSFTFGLRAGYWFDFLPLIGVQFDLYFFNPDISIPASGIVSNIEDDFNFFEFDVNVVALGFSVLGRYPFLKSPEFPRGRLQPYLGLGPAIFITSWDDQESDTDLNIGSETVVNGGLQFMAGASFFIREAISVFAEYKFTHHVTQIGGIAAEDRDGDGFTEIVNISLVGNQPFNVSHFTFGVTYHFY